MNFLKNQALWAMLIGGAVLTATACKKDDDEEPVDPPAAFATSDLGGGVTRISGSTDGNYTMTNDRTWLLSGFVYVNSGATLTIEAGTIIKGDFDSKGTLIIKRGGKIMAQGTSTEPIVFTSNLAPGSRDYGDWGGIIICGNGNNNQPDGEAIIEGGPDAYYGGKGSPNDADNSGVMQYVRIEFPGIPFQTNQEINGLTLGAVGSATTIDHIQVSYSGDDSYEFFGGAVNAKYLVALAGWDDDFDSDNGFRGKVQFAVSMRDHNVADQSGSNGFESDNDASGSTISPYTKPLFSNVSILGPGTESSETPNTLFKRGAHLRRNSRCNIHNSLIAGFPTGLYIDGSLSGANASGDELQVRNTIVAGCATPLDTAAGTGLDIPTWFNTSGWNNSVVNDLNDLGLGLPLSLTGPALLPEGGSPLMSGADFGGNLSDPFFEQVTFRGAFGSDDWTAGWCNWDPQNTVY